MRKLLVTSGGGAVVGGWMNECNVELTTTKTNKYSRKKTRIKRQSRFGTKKRLLLLVLMKIRFLLFIRVVSQTQTHTHTYNNVLS